MALINKERISVQLKNRTRVDGKNVYADNGAPTTIWGSVQPAPAKAIQMLPEGARASAKWIVYTEGKAKPLDIFPTPPGVAPRLTTSRGVLVPLVESDFSHAGPGAVLPNCAYICAAVAADEPTP